MKTEDRAWRELRHHASAQLRPGFADRALKFAHGPGDPAWQQLRASARGQLRPGFAERVLRAVRIAAEGPSLLSQFALSAATATVCLAAVLLVHDHNVSRADERNLAHWQNIVLVAQEVESSR